MKRIANNVAVQTVLYTVSGGQRVKVLNRKNIWDKNPLVVFDGECRNLILTCNPGRIAASKVYGIDIVDNILVITIQNKDEEF